MAWSAAILAATLLVEGAGGFLSGSLALLSDATHVGADLALTLLTLWSLRLSRRPADDDHTFGHGRAQVLVAFGNGVALCGVSGWIAFQSTTRLFRPVPIDSLVMLWSAVPGLVANLACVRLLRGCSGLASRAALMNAGLDALLSVAVIAAALLTSLLGWGAADPVAGLLIAACVGWGGAGIAREAGTILMEGTPKGLDTGRVAEAVRSLEGIRGVHDCHIWSIEEGLPSCSVHVEVEPGQPGLQEEVLSRVKETLSSRFGIRHSTVQIEPVGYRHQGEEHEP